MRRAGREAEWTLAARTAILNCRTGLRIQRTLPLRVYWKGGAPWQRVLDVGNGLARHMFLTPSQPSGVLQFTPHGKDGRSESLGKDATAEQ